MNHADEVSLGEAGAVGATCGHFYDRRGQMCSNGLKDRIIGLTLDELKRSDTRLVWPTVLKKSMPFLGPFGAIFSMC